MKFLLQIIGVAGGSMAIASLVMTVPIFWSVFLSPDPPGGVDLHMGMGFSLLYLAGGAVGAFVAGLCFWWLRRTVEG